MVKFYKVTFQNKFGNSLSKNVVGSYSQVKAWADKECFALGATCDIEQLAIEDFNDIKNLANC